MSSLFPLVMFLAIALIIWGAIWSYRQQKIREEQLGQVAARLGWRFDPSRDRNHDDEYAHFEIFRSGHSRYAYNTLTGSQVIRNHDFPVKMGDFHYEVTTSSGKSTTTVTHRFSYLILHLPFAAVPDVLVRPEGLLDHLAGFLGLEDIDFESAEFSRRYFVKSSDKRFAYDLIDPRMIEFLLQGPRLTIDIENGRCCITDGKKTWPPEHFLQMAQWSRQFFEHWPDHLVTSLDGRQ